MRPRGSARVAPVAWGRLTLARSTLDTLGAFADAPTEEHAAFVVLHVATAMDMLVAALADPVLARGTPESVRRGLAAWRTAVVGSGHGEAEATGKQDLQARLRRGPDGNRGAGQVHDLASDDGRRTRRSRRSKAAQAPQGEAVAGSARPPTTPTTQTETTMAKARKSTRKRKNPTAKRKPKRKNPAKKRKTTRRR